jgi:sugar lactone lactonase YvrE
VEPGSAVHIDFSVDVGTGILVIDKTGKVTDTIPGPQGAYFNGIAYAGHGFYVIADSGSPVIWRFDLAKRHFEPWLKDGQLSAPADARPNNIAGNGIKVYDGWVYVAVTSRNAIYRIRMDSKGGPKGALTMFAQGFRPDDFDITKDGTIYLPSGTSLFKISPAGEVTKFLDGAGLSAATRISLDGKWVYWPTRGGTEPQRLLRVAIP